MSNQMEKFGASLRAVAKGEKPEFYSADYIYRLSEELSKTVPIEWEDSWWGYFGGNRILQWQYADLKAFGVEFDTWSHESFLHIAGAEEFRRLCIVGCIQQIGKDGQLICGVCASLVEENEPCQYCLGEHCVIHGEEFVNYHDRMFKNPIDPFEDEDERGYREWRNGQGTEGLHPGNLEIDKDTWFSDLVDEIEDEDELPITDKS